MTVHLVKLCVGASSVADLENWVARRVLHNKQLGRGAIHDHVTRMIPRRLDDLLNGGSIYWVIKGAILVRQEISDIGVRIGTDGVKRCEILLKPKLIATEPQARRAFQGWRYLSVDDAPKDIKNATGKGHREPPPELSAELAALGLI